jgi:hypothetical protein
LLGNFDVCKLDFGVKILWEFNPNKAKSLEFGGVPKAQEEGP